MKTPQPGGQRIAKPQSKYESRFNTMRPEQHGRIFVDDIIKCNFYNENWCTFIWISLKFAPGGPIDNTCLIVVSYNSVTPIWPQAITWNTFVAEDTIDNKSALHQLMACRLLGDKLLPEIMSTEISVAWPKCLTYGSPRRTILTLMKHNLPTLLWKHQSPHCCSFVRESAVEGWIFLTKTQ